jgi:hypothetical protein
MAPATALVPTTTEARGIEATVLKVVEASFAAWTSGTTAIPSENAAETKRATLELEFIKTIL